MSTTLGNRIHVRGQYQYEEAIANAGISPGHLIERLSTGKVQKHATAGGPGERWFAIEDANTGASVFSGATGKTVGTAYAALDVVPSIKCERGTIVNAFLKGSSNGGASYSYAVGDKLVSAGDGTLEKATLYGSAAVEKEVIAVVEDSAVDLSGSGAVSTLHPVSIV